MLRSLIPALGAAVLCGASLSSPPAAAGPSAGAAPLAVTDMLRAEPAQYYYGRRPHYRRHYGPRYRYWGPRPYYYGPPRIIAPFPFAPPPPRRYGPRYYW